MNILDYSAVSFDIFDTLIKRITSTPSDVFRIVEEELNKEFDCDTRFYIKRLKAKENIRVKNRFYNIDDIYNIIDLPENQKEHALQCEKTVEIGLCYPNNEIFKFFESCKRHKKRIFIITDMYLDRSTIESMLAKCGITGYEKLYISQEVKKEKNGGKLFRLFLKENGLKSSQVLHIGDNVKVDIFSAKLCGIHTKRVKETFQSLTYKSRVGLKENYRGEYLRLLRLLESHKEDITNEWQSIGYECLGPMLWGFCNWLSERLNEKGIRNVYFLSREGDIIKRAFEALYEDKYNCYYLYVSRRSLTVPSYAKYKSFEEVVKTLSLPKNLTVKQFYDAIGVDSLISGNGIKKVGLSGDENINGWNVASNTALKNSFEYIKNDIFSIYKKQYELIQKYLNQNDFFGEVAIVDIGWNGTMQSALEKICIGKRNVDIQGYYFGLNANNKLDNSVANGYIYEPQRNIEFQYYLMGMSGPLEMMTTASHGTTMGYCERDGLVYPILAESEYFGSGNREEADSILHMQKGGMTFIDSISNVQLIAYLKLDGRVAVQNFYQFGKNPSIKHRKMFYGLKEYDGTIGLTMLNPVARGIRGDNSIIKGFWNSSWKIAYMKDKIHLPFPYEKIYMWMRKRK